MSCYKLFDVFYNIKVNDIDIVEYLEYFGPDFLLHTDVNSRLENNNPKPYLEAIVENVTEGLRSLAFAPAVQMRNFVPDFFDVPKVDVPPTEEQESEEKDER